MTLLLVLGVFFAAAGGFWLLLRPDAPYRLDDREWREMGFWRRRR